MAEFHCRVLGHTGTSHIEKHYERSRVLVWYLTAFALTPVSKESIPGREILLQVKSVELCPVPTTDQHLVFAYNGVQVEHDSSKNARPELKPICPSWIDWK